MAVKFLNDVAVDSSVLYVDTSNNTVGIGTTSPIATLDVTGSGIGAKIHSAQTIGLQVSGGGNLQDIARFQNVSGSTKVTINYQGNVGIGTTSPSQKLDVSGTGRFTSTLYTNSSSTSSVGIIGKSQANGWAARYDSNGTNYSGFYFDANNDASMYLRDDAGNTNVLVRSDSTSYFNGGNVGIGETNPAQKLHVVGNSEITGDIFLGRYIFHNDDTNTWLGFPLADTISFRTNGSDRMYITSAGNVGVGTTNPQRKFHVNGIARVEANGQTLDLVGTDHSYIGFYPDGAVAGRKAYIGFPGATTNRLTISNEFNDDISFFTNGSEKVTIENSGDVGIGTTSPAVKLEVEGGDALLQLSTASSTGNPYMTFSQAGTRRSFIQHRDSGDNLKIASEYGSISLFTGTAGTEVERVTIDSAGNVGIGTTSPGYKLDVDGDARITQDNQLILSRSGLSSSSSDSCIYVDNTFTGGGNPYNIDSDLSSYFGSRHVGFRYNGTIVGYIGASGSTAVSYSTTSSDERLKKNIEDWQENILDKFEKIEPKKFNFISEAEGENKTKGFIAQKMFTDFPEAYPHDYSEEKYRSFNPSGMVVYLMKAVKELVEKNKELENRLQILEGK